MSTRLFMPASTSRSLWEITGFQLSIDGRFWVSTEVDALHHAGEDLTAHLNIAHARRPGRQVLRVTVDFRVRLPEGY
jgi:hypothetical protein